jgi:hypothetical protein
MQICAAKVRFRIRKVLAILNLEILDNKKRIVPIERMHAGELILISVVVNMPRKSRPRKPVKPDDVREEVWIAPRPANRSKPPTFEPVRMSKSNRYLEFADIAFGAKTLPPKKKESSSAKPAQKQSAQHRQANDHHAQDHHAFNGKVTPINRRPSKPRGSREFGAFRNSR